MKETNEFTNLIIPDNILKNWQEIVDLMATIIDIPAGLIMRIVDEDIEVFVSSKTDKNPYSKGDKEHLLGSGLYCETVINTKKKLLIPNALIDKDWKNNPDTKINMISYLGFPLLFPDGTPFGTICVLDNKENHYSQIYEKAIIKFREIIHSHLELLYANKALGEKNRTLRDHIEEIKTLRGLIPICAWCKKIRDDEGYWQTLELYLQNHSEAKFSHGICPECVNEITQEKKINS